MDVVGCFCVFLVDLLVLELLQVNVLFSNLDCMGGVMGNVEVLSVSGGVLFYVYDLNVLGFIVMEVYFNLFFGEYQFMVQDVNVCLVDSVVILVGWVILLVDVGLDLSVDFVELVIL